MIVITLSIVTLCVIPLTFSNKYLFGGLIITCFFEFSYLYPSLLTHCNYMYGSKLGPNVFALCLLGVAITTLTVSSLKIALPVIGYGGVCICIAAMLALNYALVLRITETSRIVKKEDLASKLV